MRVLVLAGTQLRHRYFASRIEEELNVVGLLNYERRIIPNVHFDKQNIIQDDQDLLDKHIKNLVEKEKRYFGHLVRHSSLDDIRSISVKGVDALNSAKTIDWVEQINADVIVDYGSGILRKTFLDASPDWIINLHGGISPYYKGSATLFWPFYFQQPELAGITYHLITNEIDGGPILQHYRPEIKPKDDFHDIGCRAIFGGTKVGIKLLRKLEKFGKLPSFPQKLSGKLFWEKDFKPAHLRVAYDLLGNGLIKDYLESKENLDQRYELIDQLANE